MNMNIVLRYFPVFGLSFISNLTYAQLKDTIFFGVIKLTSSEAKDELYEVTIRNGRVAPVCIMHSAYINLFLDPPQRLALLGSEKSKQLFSLHYAARDTLNNYEKSNPNYNGEIVLPLQEIKFRLLIPRSDANKSILFEYIILNDFCYNEFKAAIYRNAATWYSRYRKHEYVSDISQ
jgi:hypothetical protein